MFNLFQHRVATERRILSIINGSKKFTTELSGLTSLAIEKWRNSLPLHSTHGLDQITDSLNSLAIATHSIVNVSDEIFEEFEASDIEHKILLLSSMVDELILP